MPRSTATGRTAAGNRFLVRDFGTCLNFVRDSSHKVVLTQTSGLPIYSASGYSVSGWFRRRPVANDTALYAENNFTSTLSILHIFISSSSSNKITIKVRNEAGTIQINDVTSTITFHSNIWHHFVWTDNNGTAKLYINGVLDTTNYNYTPAGTYTMTSSGIGVIERSSPLNWFNGSLDEFKLYNAVLTQTDVTNLYYSGLTSKEANLKGHYKFNEGSGTSATDSSGNGNTGTITGATYTSDVPIKTRKAVNGNLVYNGDFEYAPAVNVATTSGDKWIDGTIGGGTTTNEIFGWYFWNYASSYAAMFDTTTKYSGNASMKVSTTGTGSTAGLRVSVHSNTSFRQNNIPVLPNTSYTCSAMIKTQVISGAATTGARLQFVTSTGTNDIATTTVVTGLNTTKDWTLYTTTFTSNATARYVTPVLQIIGNNGAGTLIMDAWFDDIILKPTTPETRTIVT